MTPFEVLKESIEIFTEKGFKKQEMGILMTHKKYVSIQTSSLDRENYFQICGVNIISNAFSDKHSIVDFAILSGRKVLFVLNDESFEIYYAANIL